MIGKLRAIFTDAGLGGEWNDRLGIGNPVSHPSIKRYLKSVKEEQGKARSKDCQHALEIFRDYNFLGQDKLIFTMDVSSLYTVIPNNEGLLALKYFLDQRTVKEPSSETLLRVAELVLTPIANCFSFAGNYYAMGTKMEPSYASLFVGYVEHQFFIQYDLISTVATLTIATALFHPAERNSIVFLLQSILFIQF